jgi:alpha-L-fucosidase
MGEWLDIHGRSIYSCVDAPEGFETPLDCRLTYNPEINRLYIHLFSWPSTGELYLEGPGVEKVKYAQLLHDASELKLKARAVWQSSWEKDGKNTLSMKLPIEKPSVLPVIELYLD